MAVFPVIVYSVSSDDSIFSVSSDDSVFSDASDGRVSSDGSTSVDHIKYNSMSS